MDTKELIELIEKAENLKSSDNEKEMNFAFENCNTDKGLVNVFEVPGQYFTDRLANLGHILYGDSRNIKY